MIRSLILVTAVGLSVATLTLGAAAWLDGRHVELDLDPLPLALALGLAASALTVGAAILASFRGAPHAIERPR
jgi:uncharacterized membrane protein YidH (DUF202 family)